MQNSIVMFTFSVFDREYVFCANLVQKIKTVSSSQNLMLSLIQIFRIQWCCSFCSFFGLICPVCDNFVQKIKIVSLWWNLIPRIIWICWIRWRCSLFLLLTGDALLGQFGPNFQYLQFKVKLDTGTNSIMQNSMAVFTFFFSIRNALLV